MEIKLKATLLWRLDTSFLSENHVLLACLFYQQLSVFDKNFVSEIKNYLIKGDKEDNSHLSFITRRRDTAIY